MTFLNSWAFGFLGIVPVIVLLYLLKVKRRSASVSTLMFWQRVLVENRRRALFQRLRQLLSLLLHLLIFTLIMLALAKPELSRLVRSGASTVLIFDTRARMQAVEDDGETRFARSRRLLDAHTRRANASNVMALLTLGARAEIAAPFTDDEKALQQAVALLQPIDASGDLAEALRLADELLASRAGAKNIVLFTDRPLTKPPNISAPVECVVVGKPHDNAAITRFAARSLLNSPQTSQLLLEMRNFGAKPVRGNVELLYDERLVDMKPFELAADGRSMEVFSSIPRGAANARGWLRARLDVKDSLALDNEAFAVIPPNEKRRVLLVTRGNWFIEKLLDADELLKWELLTPDAFSADMAASFDAVILDNALPPQFDLEKTRGNFLFIKQTPFTAPDSVEQPLISDVNERSPLMRLVALQNVTFLRSARMDFRESSGAWQFDAPLRSFEHPLIITGQRRLESGSEQRLAALGFDVTETDLPLRVAFPLLMANTLQWLAGENTSEPVVNVRAGETMPLAPDEVIFTTPQKSIMPTAQPQPAPAARGSFQPLKNGWYLVQNGTRASWLAVNTFSESESDLRFTPAAPATDSQPPLALALSGVTGWPLWMQLALVAFALFALEWWLFHRRRTE